MESAERRDVLRAELPDPLRQRVDTLGRQVPDDVLRTTLRALCAIRGYTADELAVLTGRNARYLKQTYLRPMLRDGELSYTIPDMPKHPDQAYRVPADREGR